MLGDSGAAKATVIRAAATPVRSRWATEEVVA
jgi:hypothetical protein